jgi:hypothetical protein
MAFLLRPALVPLTFQCNGDNILIQFWVYRGVLVKAVWTVVLSNLNVKELGHNPFGVFDEAFKGAVARTSESPWRGQRQIYSTLSAQNGCGRFGPNAMILGIFMGT